jgi:hypothetical protein
MVEPTVGVDNTLPRGITAIVDTNVLIDVLSSGDLERAYQRSNGTDSDEATFRRVRSRESLILAWYLHSRGAKTCSLDDEPLRTLMAQAEPADKTKLQTQHVQLSVHLVNEHVLDRWTWLTISESIQE